jgi:hypothetical protein
MSRTQIPAELARIVRDRATNRCEYCQLPQSCQEATFHIDHIEPRRAGGQTTLENLALACVTCSLKKGARTSVVDPESGEAVPIFNPRSEVWEDHFSWTFEWCVVGLSPCGRGTVEVLGMNRPAAVAIRSMLAELGKFPERSNPKPGE